MSQIGELSPVKFAQILVLKGTIVGATGSFSAALASIVGST